VTSNHFLSIAYTPSSTSVGTGIGRFLYYLQYRDHIQRGEEGRGTAGLVRYVAYHDQASPQDRLFTRHGAAGDRERKQLARFVERSLEGVSSLRLNQDWRRLRAFYSLVFSPDDARGLDLRSVAREIMAQLQHDAGGIPPWLGAEHRDTAHPHIHVAMAGRHELASGQFRELQVSRQRLARMKAAMGRDIERQRGDRAPDRTLDPGSLDLGWQPVSERERQLSRRLGRAPSPAQGARADPLGWQQPPRRTHRRAQLGWYPMPKALARLAGRQRTPAKGLNRAQSLARDAGEEREWEVYE
jgi:hypothetical protein